MTRVRRRLTRERRGLTREERFYLLTGHRTGTVDGSAAFAWRDLDGEWQTDDAEARAAWLEHRDELLDDAAERGLIPWAAHHFDGMPGLSPYEHLEGYRS